ncbi:hypothetical protein GRF29_154g1449650 [Pseudopithomyces chartarum]|uniref:pyridoxal 5'-phosphate synthase n=1 Tax=Pseudopithomyces chartarum TaxID=1892770 RepID=A0AAN6RF38_9PLEO|nr:hypothetical protein GRF29_154g1449650 [Pseudopithomyces chartarum]
MSTTTPTPTPTPEKRIFAPTGGSSTPGQAVQYTRGTLSPSTLSPSPTTQFHTWFRDALSASVYQPETVTLATASLPSGTPSARIVFLKELDATGFVIYSNREHSRKARDLASNPQAALTFWWHEVERQVRVEGKVEYLSAEESQVSMRRQLSSFKEGFDVPFKPPPPHPSPPPLPLPLPLPPLPPPLPLPPTPPTPILPHTPPGPHPLQSKHTHPIPKTNKLLPPTVAVPAISPLPNSSPHWRYYS